MSKLGYKAIQVNSNSIKLIEQIVFLNLNLLILNHDFTNRVKNCLHHSLHRGELWWHVHHVTCENNLSSITPRNKHSPRKSKYDVTNCGSSSVTPALRVWWEIGNGFGLAATETITLLLCLCLSLSLSLSGVTILFYFLQLPPCRHSSC